MVFRVATRHVSQPERCLTATARLRAGASRAQTSLLDRSKTAISLAIWVAPGDADFSELSLHFIPPHPIVQRPKGLFVSQVGRSFPRSQRPFSRSRPTLRWHKMRKNMRKKQVASWAFGRITLSLWKNTITDDGNRIHWKV